MFLEVKFIIECEIIFLEYVFKELMYDFTEQPHASMFVILCFQVLIPSVCGMLVYNDLTSIVATMVLGGNGVSRSKMVCKK